jgi:hypothetical protein
VLDRHCNYHEALVLVGDRVYVFDWSNASFTEQDHLSVTGWLHLLKQVTLDPSSAK